MTLTNHAYPHDPGTFRYKNIVYKRTDKCGGTYYKNLFKAFGFEQIGQHEILETDKIFTFIIDPKKRRVKAIAQLIYNTQNQKLLEDKNFLRFIGDICITDCHTYPYFLQYLPIEHRTVFLPLDHDTLPAEKLLRSYFQVHCPELASKSLVNDNLYANKADKTKQAIYQKISENLKSYFFEKVFQQDFALYQNTMDGVDHDLAQHLTSKYDK